MTMLANYLLMLGIGSVFALLFGLASHAGQAYLATPESWNRDIFGRWVDPPHPKAVYDEQGFWEFASLNNYLYHAGGCLLIVWGLGLWYWDRQDFALAQVCEFVGHIGVKPIFCI